MALALMRMIKPPGRIIGGEMLVDGVDLTQLSEEEMRKARASQVSMIPQGAMNSLNPVMRIGDQIVDTIRAHSDRSLDKGDAVTRSGSTRVRRSPAWRRSDVST